jgi:valyl-tRNA synthetase
VLDTWFSSALWPFATLGWPDQTPEMVKRHYPNDLLVSGFDILFFWDARMAMQGMHFMGEVPWKRLYLHGLVRAGRAEDVQVQGQRGRSAGPDRQVWRRRAALLHGGDGIAGPRREDG